MTQEEKQLLLVELCARLPYGIKILHEGWNYELDDELLTVERVVGIDDMLIYTKVIDTHNGEEYRDDSHSIDIFDDKLFLRPMSSMTEEEQTYWDYVSSDGGWGITEGLISECADWLNAHHFDYRGLIEKGLAIAVDESNNPYKE